MKLGSATPAMLAWIAVLGCACQAVPKVYHGVPGPRLDKREVATVKVDPSESSIRFQRIDGDFLDQLDWGHYVWTLELLPGKHRLEAAVFMESNATYAHVEFDVEAGHTYLARAFERQERIFVWIEDEATRALAGGIKPDAD